jgi:hypothetical protein
MVLAAGGDANGRGEFKRFNIAIDDVQCHGTGQS